MLANYAPVLIFLIISGGLGLVLLSIGLALGKGQKSAAKSSPYECGFEAFEDSRMRFDVRYYLVAILFIIFDLEIAFLFPWAVVYKDLSEKFGAFAFIEMMVFVFILLVGLAYVWAKGDLEWDKPKTVPSIELSSRQEQTEPVHERVS